MAVSADFGRDGWERRWEQVVREHPNKLRHHSANQRLVDIASALTSDRPWRVLDAGCGHGSEALWLAEAGGDVTAVDFSATALEVARARALERGHNLADRITWLEADLGDWAPAPGSFDLVSCLYVHVAGSVEDMVTRLASGVAPGGTLLLVGHPAVDPVTGAATAAAGQHQVSVEEALAVLSPDQWSIQVADYLPRTPPGTGVDAVVHAVRSAK